MLRVDIKEIPEIAKQMAQVVNFRCGSVRALRVIYQAWNDL